MGNVITAIQVVVYKHLPVAVEAVVPALKKMKRAQIQRRDALHQSPEEIAQGCSSRIEVHKDKLLPDLYPHPKQPILRSIKPADALELGSASQRAVETVAPAVVGTAKDAGDAFVF